MKQIKTILLLSILSLSLLACDGSGETSTSNNYLNNYTDDEIQLMESHLNGNIIPYCEELFYGQISVDASSSQIYSSNYSIAYNNITNMVTLLYPSDYVEDVETYYNFVKDDYTLDDQLTNQEEHDYYLFKDLSIDGSGVSSQLYLNVYYDDISLGLTIDAYIDSTYTFTSWPSGDNNITNYLGLFSEDIQTYFEFAPQGLVLISMTTSNSFVSYLPMVNLTLTVNNSSSLQDFVTQLLDKGYLLDDVNSTETQNNYYVIVEDESLGTLSLECYVDNQITTIDDNTYQYNLSFTYNI